MYLYHDLPPTCLCTRRMRKYIHRFLIEMSWLRAHTGRIRQLPSSDWILDWGPDNSFGNSNIYMYLDLIKQHQPAWIVAPDVLGDRRATRQSYDSFIHYDVIIPYLRSSKIIWPIQGINNEELLASARDVSILLDTHLPVSVIAKLKICLGIPYRVFGGDTCVERARNRVKFILQDLKQIRRCFSSVHLLGLWDIDELALCAHVPYVISADSRFAFLQAYLGKTVLDFRDVGAKFDSDFAGIRLSLARLSLLRDNIVFMNSLVERRSK